MKIRPPETTETTSSPTVWWETLDYKVCTEYVKSSLTVTSIDTMYSVVNKKTNQVEFRSPQLAHAIGTAVDLQGLLDKITGKIK